MKRKLVSLMMVTAMSAALLAGCGSDKGGSAAGKDNNDNQTQDVKDNNADDTSKAEQPAGEGSVYYMNFKPEVDAIWQDIAKAYTEETGVPVKVVTAASGQYEATLRTEIVGTNAPTLFQINGPVGYQKWKDYCLELSDTDLYKNLSDQSLAVTGDDGAFMAFLIQWRLTVLSITMPLWRSTSRWTVQWRRVWMKSTASTP